MGAAKKGLVRLDHAAQRLARRRRRPQEPVPPAEARRQVHAAMGGRLGQAHPGRERLTVGQPAGLLAQPRQGGAGQGVEGLPTGPAAIAAQPAGMAPALRRRCGAVRATRRGGERILEQPGRLRLARRRRQGPPERRPLRPAEPLDQPQEHPSPPFFFPLGLLVSGRPQPPAGPPGGGFPPPLLARQVPAKRGELTGPNPTDRGKPGTKRHVLVDAGDIPLSSGADTSERARQRRAGAGARRRPAGAAVRRAVKGPVSGRPPLNCAARPSRPRRTGWRASSGKSTKLGTRPSTWPPTKAPTIDPLAMTSTKCGAARAR